MTGFDGVFLEVCFFRGFMHTIWKYIAYCSATCTTVWGPLDWWCILSIQLSPTQVVRGGQVGVHAEDLSIQQPHGFSLTGMALF